MDQEKNISQHKNDEVVDSAPIEKHQGRVISALFSGPIPPPNALEAYERICPGSADRILSLWERQVDHRQGLEKVGVSASVRHEWWGMHYAFILTVSLMLTGIVFVYKGKSVGWLAIFAPVVFHAANYIYIKKSEREEKKQSKDLQDSEE
jgi:uncharacterized membrane protein